HLEADIHALKNNPNGFPEGFWMPYLTIAYELKNTDTGAIKRGSQIAMTYGYIFVAQVNSTANYSHLIKAIMAAEAYDGPSLIIC
ncbi:iron transporter, partial [Campylobacter coli]|uniref:iron transporter n=1 Tax=Campylobacter coli TaxID=195 RepID=UPI002E2F41BA